MKTKRFSLRAPSPDKKHRRQILSARHSARVLLAAASALLMILGTAAASRAQYYNVTDLGGVGYGINNAGQIVGHDYSDANFVAHAAFFTVAGGQVSRTDLGTLTGGSNAAGFTINSHGQISGQSDLSDGSIHATLFTLANGTVSRADLGVLNGGIDSSAYGINEAGQLVGNSLQDTQNTYHAVLYMVSNGTVNRTDLTPTAGASSTAYAINNFGQIAGVSSSGLASPDRATLFTVGGDGTATLTDFGANTASSVAMDINDAGQMAGSYTTDPAPGAASRAALWTVSGGAASLVDLGSLGGSSAAIAINSSGQIVGNSYLSDGSGPHAFLYRSVSGMQDLNSLVDPRSGFSKIQFPQDAAHCINDAGQIVAIALVGGSLHGILLTPPSPVSVSIISVGVDTGKISRRSGEVATVTFTRNGGDTSQPIKVAYHVKTTLIGGSDYVALKGIVKIKSGKTSRTLMIVPLNGGADGKLQLTLQPHAGYTVGNPAKVKVKITD